MAKDVKFRHAANKDCADAQAGFSLHWAEADLSYARACSEYQDFVGGGRLLTTRLLTQGNKPVSKIKKFYGRHYDLVSPYMCCFQTYI